MPEIGSQRPGIVGVVGELVAAGVPQHLGTAMKPALTATPVRSTIRANPVFVAVSWSRRIAVLGQRQAMVGSQLPVVLTIIVCEGIG
jgi:hypothetical protein